MKDLKEWLDWWAEHTVMANKKRRFSEDVRASAILWNEVHIYIGIEELATTVGQELAYSPYTLDGTNLGRYSFVYKDVTFYQIGKSEAKQ